MRTMLVVTLGCALLATDARPAASQASVEATSSLAREYLRGVLSKHGSVPERTVRDHCAPLPFVEPRDSQLDDGPHGDSLVATRCEVLNYHRLRPAPGGPWFVAQYRWTSVFTPLSPLPAEWLPPGWPREKPRDPLERDTVTHGEVVLFAAAGPGQVRPVWHQLFHHVVIRSLTLEVASATEGTTLLSVESCVNGTAGCSSEFLRRLSGGRWAPVRQTWLAQLPPGLADHIGAYRIDPRTLRGQAALYRAQDGNCCPSETLHFWLRLQGDSLVLRHQAVTPTR